MFTERAVEGLPDAARRYLLHAIEPGCVLASRTLLTMHGTIKVGRWLRFDAHEELDPHSGFTWRARLLRGLLRVHDAYHAGRGSSALSLVGVPVSRRSGVDIAASAFGRMVCEAMWSPAALLPDRGVSWTSDAEDVAIAAWTVDGREARLHLRVDAEGRLLELWASRWGDPTGEGWAWVPCGGVVEGERTFAGVTIPARVRAGWWFGSDRFKAGEFFRATVTRARFVATGGTA